jgi:hypothetical protein
MMQRRFPFCRDYAKCLEHASIFARGLDCRSCQDYEPAEKRYSAQDRAGMRALLDRIFNRGKCNSKCSIPRASTNSVFHDRAEPKSKQLYISPYDKAL